MGTLSCITILFSLQGLPPAEPLKQMPGYRMNSSRSRPRGKPAPPPLPAQDVVDAFVQSLESNTAYPEKARTFVVEEAGKASPEDLPGFIIGMMGVLSPEFEKALDLLDEEETAGAADAFETLAESNDPYMAVAAANMAATTLIEIEEVVRCEKVLDRVRRAHKPIEKYTTSSYQFRFMLGYCQVHNLAYEEAFSTFEHFLRNHPNAPERLRNSAIQILTELSRRAPGRLGDVRDLMSYAQRRIMNRVTDDDVIGRQEEAIELLDVLIEEAEEQENQGGGGDGGGGGGGSSGGGKPGGGANRSTLPDGAAPPSQLRKMQARPGEVWGRMPPKEREQILQTLQKQFPSQYRELLEQYYKQLAKDAPDP